MICPLCNLPILPWVDPKTPIQDYEAITLEDDSEVHVRCFEGRAPMAKGQLELRL